VIPLSHKGPLLCRWVYVQDDVLLSSKQQKTNVIACSTLVSPQVVADNCMVDCHQVEAGARFTKHHTTIIRQSYDDDRSYDKSYD